MPDILLLDSQAAQSGATAAGLVPIAQTVVSVAAATIDFSAIAATYESLVINVVSRGTAAATEVDLLMRLNNDSGANYDWTFLYGTASAGTAQVAGDTSGRIGSIAAASATAATATATRIKIPGYARTVFEKVVNTSQRHYKAHTTGGMSIIEAFVGWRSTAAVTRVTLLLSSGNFDVGSVATLYGVSAPA